MKGILELVRGLGSADTHLKTLNVREMQIRADSADTAKRSVEAAIATEQPVLMYDWDRGYIDEILVADGMQAPEQVPLLDSHSRRSIDDQQGIVTHFRTRKGENVGRLEFTENDERAERAWNKVQQRHVRDVSAGYEVLGYEVVDRGQTKKINGRTYTAGDRALRVSTSWLLREVSLTPIGADNRSKIRSYQAGAIPHEEESMFGKKKKDGAPDASEEHRSEEETEEVEETETVETREGQRSAVAQPIPSAGAVVDVSQAVRQALEVERSAERKRIHSIRELAGDDVPNEVVQRAISEGWDLPRAGAEFIKSIRSDRPGPSAPGIIVAPEATRESLAASLMLRYGTDPTQETKTGKPHAEGWFRFGQKKREEYADRAAQFLGLSLEQLCRQCIVMDGRTPPVGRDACIRTAMSGGTLSYIFSATIEAALAQAYSEAPDVTGSFCAEQEVSNFLSHQEIRYDVTGSIRRLGAGGTAEHLNMADARETFNIDRYAAQIWIDEQDLINDTLNALADIPRQIAVLFAGIMQDLVIANLLSPPNLADGTAVFASARGNAAATAFGTDGAAMQAGITAMRKYQHRGRTLNLSPKFLVTPAALEWSADQTVNSPLVSMAAGTGSKTVQGTKNPLYNRAQLVTDGRLDNGVTNPKTGSAVSGSAAAWFLFPDPNVTPVLKKVYRSGTNRTVQLVQQTRPAGQFGIGWDAVLDGGVAWVDWKAYRGGVALG